MRHGAVSDRYVVQVMARPTKFKPEFAKQAAKLTAIYVLLDDEGVVRYVGKSVDPQSRMQAHCLPHSRSKTPVSCWSRSMRDRGVRPTMEIIEWVENWDTAERKWIAHYRGAGAKLLNVTDGGVDASHLNDERGKYPTYRWAMMFCARAKNEGLSGILREQAQKAKDAGGAAGMRAFDLNLLIGLKSAVPFTANRLMHHYER